MYIRQFILTLTLILAAPVFAQDTSYDRFESEDGVFSFSYPTGWVAFGEAQADGSFFAMAAPESFEPTVSHIQPDQRGIFFIAFPVAALEGIPTDLPPDQLAQLFVTQLSEDSDEPLALSDPTIITLADGVEAGRIDFSGGTAGGRAIVYQQSGYIVVAAAIAHQDEIADFEPLALQIFSTFVIHEDAINQEDVVPALSELLAEATPVRKVIVDLDMAHEDMTALLYLLNHPQINVQAVTVSGTGEAHCEAGIQNALGLLELSDHSGIPVACGRETPLVGDHEFPSQWRERADTAYGVALPEVTVTSELSAVDVITSVVGASQEPITIITLGPLTNLADVLQASPAIAANIDSIYIMGGAVDMPGNVGQSGVGIDNAVAEWNIYIDPTAANIVLRSGIPVTLVPLDATADVPVTTLFYQRLGNVRESSEANFIYDILTANLDLIESGGFQFWDTLTAAIVTDESLATFEMRTVLVVEEEGPQSGYTRPDENGVSVRVATSADRPRFETLLMAVVNQTT